MKARLTDIVRSMEGEISSILASGSTIVEKAVTLRRIARRIASEYFDRMHYQNIDEFYADYDAGKTPLTELEGEGIRDGSVIILKKCPMVPLFDDFKNNGKFPDYWTEIPDAYIARFRNESILHPLCIVHQSFRDELASKIPKGKSFVHSIAVACRSGTGKVVYSEFGLDIADQKKENIARAIDGLACAFHVR